MKKNVFFLLVFAFLSEKVFAGESSGIIGPIYAHDGDVAFFSAGQHQNKPACSIAGDEWAISLSSPAGKAKFSLLLTQKALGRPVRVIGYANACTIWGDREDANYIVTD